MSAHDHSSDSEDAVSEDLSKELHEAEAALDDEEEEDEEAEVTENDEDDDGDGNEADASLLTTAPDDVRRFPLFASLPGRPSDATPK